jgi:hypothetical protein
MREAIKHPLSGGGFYEECIRHALAGMWGVMSSIATALGLFGGAIKWALSSESFVQWTAILAKHGGADLLWEVPGVSGLIILLLRLLSAPYLLYRAGCLSASPAASVVTISTESIRELAAVFRPSSDLAVAPRVLLPAESTDIHPLVDRAGEVQATAFPIGRKSRSAARARLEYEEAREKEGPDIQLEFSSPGPFILRNFGKQACEVTIGDLTIPEFYEVRFPLVADLHAGSRPIVPEVVPIGLWKMMQRDDTTARGFMDFLSTLARGKAMDTQRERSSTHMSSAVTDDLVATMDPIALPLTVTYKDRHGKRQWVKNETLIYHPPKRQAYIKHGEREEIKLSR